ncbi:MAG: 2-oxo acid dehydrogenase subunit E2 [Aggregatilineales bacterium]
MNNTKPGYSVLPFRPQRRIIMDAGRMGRRRHLVHGLVEFDVTEARQRLRAVKAAGQPLSFTAFIVVCLAQALTNSPLLHAYRNWRNQLIVFDDVDVVTLIEAERDGVAIPHIIRAANRKSVQAISQEIRAVQARPSTSSQRSGVLARLGPYMPRFLRDAYFVALQRSPHQLKQVAGTTVVTAVGMFARGSGWGFGFLPIHTLGLTLGGIAEKPAVLSGKIVIREFLCVTISLDHDIADGAAAARFAGQLRGFIESAFGLEPAIPVNS